MPRNSEPPASVALPARRIAFGPPRAAALPDVAIEVPVSIAYGSLPYAVMMASPADLEDFVLGFSLTEGVIAEPGEVRAVTLRAEREGIRAEVTLAAARMRAHLARTRRRSLAGRTSCGVCGVESLEDLPQAAPRRVAASGPRPASVAAALATLEPRQALHRLTRAVHAAAWCDPEGRIVALREDVGRHNALDKLIGARLRAGCDRDGFVLVTSRASYEMVEKAAMFGAPALVAVSAPTSLAVERAMALGLTLLASARADGAILYAGSLAGTEAVA